MSSKPNLNLPEDHADLLAFAQDLHQDLVDHRHSSDCVVAQKPDTKQFVHIPHDQLRAKLKAARESGRQAARSPDRLNANKPAADK